MSQRDITLREFHATPKTIILRALEPALPSPTTTIYLYEFHATPSTVVLGDPTTVRVTGGAQTYTFTGDVALVFAPASPHSVTAAEPVGVALEFVVASPVAVVVAAPASVALEFAVSSPQSATYSEPAGVALEFGVDSPWQFIPSTTEVPISGGQRVTLRWKPKPRVYTFEGRVSLRFGVHSPHSVVSVPPAGIARPRFLPRSPRKFVLVPPPLEPLSEADQLVLAGLL